MIDICTLIAQTTRPAAPPSGMGTLLFPLVMMGVIFYFIMIRPQSREKKRRATMLAALKKNDRVVTIGGIYGTVTAVRDDEVTLKVDESSNTKITFSRSAVQKFVADPQAASNAPAVAKK